MPWFGWERRGLHAASGGNQPLYSSVVKLEDVSGGWKKRAQQNLTRGRTHTNIHTHTHTRIHSTPKRALV